MLLSPWCLPLVPPGWSAQYFPVPSLCAGVSPPTELGMSPTCWSEGVNKLFRKGLLLLFLKCKLTSAPDVSRRGLLRKLKPSGGRGTSLWTETMCLWPMNPDQRTARRAGNCSHELTHPPTAQEILLTTPNDPSRAGGLLPLGLGDTLGCSSLWPQRQVTGPRINTAEAEPVGCRPERGAAPHWTERARTPAPLPPRPDGVFSVWHLRDDSFFLSLQMQLLG